MKKKIFSAVLLILSLTLGIVCVPMAASGEDGTASGAENEVITGLDNEKSMDPEDEETENSENGDSSDTEEENPEPVKKTGFQKEGDAIYYYGEDGIAVKDTGWKQIEGIWYYLEQGRVKTGWLLFKGVWYYLNPNDGAMETGWYQVKEKWYYSNANGAMLSGGWKLLDGKWYYLEDSGAACIGWLKSNGKWYYLNPEDRAMETGWYQVKEKWYYSDGNGAMLSGGWKRINGKWYYLESSGAAFTGWLKSNGKWYYLDPTDCAMKTGWYQVKDIQYYSDENGAMKTGWVKINGTWYYFNASGAMQTDWINLNGKWYYLDENGAMQIGWIQLEETWYYLDQNGVMQTGWLKWNGKWYYLDKSGAMAADTWIGIYYVDADGVWDASKCRVSHLKAAQTTDQLLVVDAVGTTARISFHEKDENGSWTQVFMTDGYVGREGIGTADAFHSRTPIGTFTLGMVFGIKDNPGTGLPYTKVDSTHYWVGDSSSPYYNQFVSTRNITNFDKNASEHLIDYGAIYNYCIDMGYNTSCTPYAGAGFFVHCSADRPTGGCVSMPESKMILLIQKLKKGAKILVGDSTQIESY